MALALKDPEIVDPTGGANQSGLRDQNARVVLSFIRRHGAMPSAEIARRSGLSAQTVSNIIRSLEADGLLLRGKSVKGKVGKPSVPVTLNPKGAYAIGLNIGRRSAELVLVDFLGTLRDRVTTTYPYPTIEGVFDFLNAGIAQVLSKHPSVRPQITGIGVARPSKLWEWLEIVHAPKDAMMKWRTLDIERAVSERTGFDAFIENDATSACVAEHLLGRGNEFSSFAYMFLGSFIGGGLVLNGRVFSGQTGNAASIGPMPVPDGNGGTTELLNVTSLHVLESLLRRDGVDPMLLRQHPDDWCFCTHQIDEWIERSSKHLAIASAAITSVVEVEAILMDGAMPKQVCAQLTHATQRAFDDLGLTLIERPEIEQATVGRNARSLGAALLPIHSRFFLT